MERPKKRTILPLDEYHRQQTSTEVDEDDTKPQATGRSGVAWGWYLLFLIVGLAILGVLIYLVLVVTGTVSTTSTASIPPPPTTKTTSTTPKKGGFRIPNVNPSIPVVKVVSQLPPVNIQTDIGTLPSSYPASWTIDQWLGDTRYTYHLNPLAQPRTYQTMVTGNIVPTMILRLVLLTEDLHYTTIAQSVPGQLQSLVQESTWSDEKIMHTFDRITGVLDLVPLKLEVVFSNGTVVARKGVTNANTIINAMRPPSKFPSTLVTTSQTRRFQTSTLPFCADGRGICILSSDCNTTTTIENVQTLLSSNPQVVNTAGVAPIITRQTIQCPLTLVPTTLVLGSPTNSTAGRNGFTILMNKEIYQWFLNTTSVLDHPAGSLDQTIENILSPPHQVVATSLDQVVQAFNDTFVYNPLAKAVVRAIVNGTAPSNIELRLAQCVLSSKLDLRTNNPTMPTLDILQADLCFNPDCYDISTECQSWLAQHDINTYLNDLLKVYL